MLVGDSVSQFIESVRARRKPATYEFYHGRLKPFRERFRSKKCRKLTAEDIEAHLDHVNHWPTREKKAPDTIRANIIGIEQWQNFAVKRDHLRKQLIDEFDKPAGRIRDWLPTEADVEAIKKLMPPEFGLIWQGERQCGSRPNELARATIADWDRVNNEIVLLDHKTAGKTGLPRRIVVGEAFKQTLIQAIGDRTSGPIFLTPRYRQWNSNSLSAAFRKLRNQGGFDKRWVNYTTRHEHGTAVYNEAGELACATALGHKGTGMVFRYAHLEKATRIAHQDACKF